MPYRINGRMVVNAPPGFPRAFKSGKHKGKAYEYVVNASKAIGRYILPGEVVHHRDRNSDNNSPDNLIVIKSNAVHSLLHGHNCDESLLIRLDDGSYTMTDEVISRLREEALQATKKRNKEYQIRRSLNRSSTARTCPKKLTCFTDNDHVHGRADYPKIGELKRLIWEKPETALAKDYGVTGNAVKKWCKAYNIDRPPFAYWRGKRLNYSRTMTAEVYL